MKVIFYIKYILFAILVAVIGLALSSSAIAKQKTTSKIKKESSALHPAFIRLGNDVPSVNWNEDESQIKANDYIKYQIEKSYINAWKWLNASLEYEDYRGMEDYFDTRLSHKIIDQANHNPGLTIQSDISHNITIQHVSMDYGIVIFEDKNVELVKQITLEDNTQLNTVEFYDLEVEMILQEGKWKILNWTSTLSKNQFPSLKTNSETLNHNLQFVKNAKGINYYPSATPWYSFWSEYDSLIVDQDLGLIQSFGMNTVRIFIGTEFFGRNEINIKAISHLDHVLKSAADHNLKVIATLFDFPVGFELHTYPSYKRQLRYILERYKDNTAIIAWNLKNEPDLDFNHHSEQNVMQWLTYLIDYIRVYDHKHPITIGWSTYKHAHKLAEKVDYISYHHYKNIETLKGSIQQIKKYNKIILIEEFGKTSDDSFWHLYRMSPENQAIYNKEVIQYLISENIPWAIWTLYDFKVAPKEVFGWKPWIKSAQTQFGIIDTLGQLKPTAEFIKNQLTKS